MVEMVGKEGHGGESYTRVYSIIFGASGVY